MDQTETGGLEVKLKCVRIKSRCLGYRKNLAKHIAGRSDCQACLKDQSLVQRIICGCNLLKTSKPNVRAGRYDMA
jgi:hypothetical protein